MVFEAVVADVLNKVLGDYIENLDRNQLKIGIWGGEFQFPGEDDTILLHPHAKTSPYCGTHCLLVYLHASAQKKQ